MLLLVRIITVQKLVAKCTVPFFIFVACLFCLFDSMARVHTALHDQAVTVTVSPPPPVCLCTVLFHFCLFLSCGSFLLSVQHCNSNCTTTMQHLSVYVLLSFYFCYSLVSLILVICTALSFPPFSFISVTS